MYSQFDRLFNESELQENVEHSFACWGRLIHTSLRLLFKAWLLKWNLIRYSSKSMLHSLMVFSRGNSIVSRSQTTIQRRAFITCCISASAEGVWSTFYTLFLAAYPHCGDWYVHVAFLTTTVPSIWYTIQLLVTLVRVRILNGQI